ncbi:MAG: ribonuclease HII [Flavobacteriaceae bacterium]|nr:ribonuclease HII [Flavobacteriaceae bacterium]|tara:strand:- start:104931 stop:105533 length:603 start_codon:yes stop_codon:yes gene_type:complete
MLKNNYSGFAKEAGTDEAGRGCLSGPVVAAAVILDPEFHHPLLNDSKKLSEKDRQLLKPIIEAEAIAYSVSFIWQQEVDEINVLQASLLGMHRALDGLKVAPEFIIVDGNKFKPYKEVPYETIVKGDGKFTSIAAASILAKTYRDAYMEKIHLDFPQYDWHKNKGYPTKKHREAIKEFGVTPHHRKTFRLLPEQLSLNFD